MSLPNLKPLTKTDLPRLRKGSTIYYKTEGWKEPYIAKMEVDYINPCWPRLRAKCVDPIASDPHTIGLESTDAPLECFLIPVEP